MPPGGEITVLLQQLATEQEGGRKAVYDKLVTLLYDELRHRARRQLAREHVPQTLQPTALVHEIYGRLADYHMTFENRDHFLNVAASAMRRLLVEEARRKKADKRWGAKQRTPLEDGTAVVTLGNDPLVLIDVDRALADLKPEQVRLVELRYFLGLSMEETAVLMGVEAEALKKRWRVIKLLLYDKLRQRHGGEAPNEF